ncbi:MAG: hypothetical protein CVV49_00475 [Spirochaetae bacterium HGW-Spirochaetae-5]|nr:MAG: hypothetical protein CVV49_00475 [Spirochaetae bacterium HGW-Spirochaetae-5]
MDTLSEIRINNVTLSDLGNNPNTFPEEVICAGLDVIKDIKLKLREIEQNMTANLINRMREDNATKIRFINPRGEERTLTLKNASPKLNGDIKDPEVFIRNSGFIPEALGEYKFVPFSWGKIKELRKQGGNIQLVCDELYKAGQPSIEIK